MAPQSHKQTVLQESLGVEPFRVLQMSANGCTDSNDIQEEGIMSKLGIELKVGDIIAITPEHKVANETLNLTYAA
jgi:hypothetical protein